MTRIVVKRTIEYEMEVDDQQLAELRKLHRLGKVDNCYHDEYSDFINDLTGPKWDSYGPPKKVK